MPIVGITRCCPTACKVEFPGQCRDRAFKKCPSASRILAPLRNVVASYLKKKEEKKYPSQIINI